jgi:phosphoglycolate phosphatase-like HAD superfamily hydrolase
VVAFVFDLDGTLVDSVYQHVLAWREALDRDGIDLSVWRIHRKIGVGVLSGGYGEDELQRAGAYRVYADPADLFAHLDEFGVRPPLEPGSG